MITLDTSALLAILNAEDRYHAQITDALRENAGPYLVPAGMLSELAYRVETRYGFRCAERHGGRVLTLDLRPFSIVAREGTLTIVPE